VQKCSLTKFAR